MPPSLPQLVTRIMYVVNLQQESHIIISNTEVQDRKVKSEVL